MKDIKGIIMFSMEIFLLGLALAFDAAVVTFAVGLMHKEHSRISIMKRGILICCTFGFFQALMMWLGSYAGYIFTFSSMGYLFQVIVGAIFFWTGD